MIDRNKLVNHLHTHPDHAWRYRAGHDFVLISNEDVRREHERLHLGLRNRDFPGRADHRHEPGTETEEERYTARRTLGLKVTVAGEDPDGTLAKILELAPRNRDNLMQLKYSSCSLDVVGVERADGQQIGLEAEFEEYWTEYNQDNRDGYNEKAAARDAFMYAYKLVKGKR